jgi:hypothetical protein
MSSARQTQVGNSLGRAIMIMSSRFSHCTSMELCLLCFFVMSLLHLNTVLSISTDKRDPYYCILNTVLSVSTDKCDRG